MTSRSSDEAARASARPPVTEGQPAAGLATSAQVNPWHPMTRPIDLKHLGKLAEELGECIGAVMFCIVYGAACDLEKTVETAHDIRVALEDEIADVLANVELVRLHFALIERPRAVVLSGTQHLEQLARKLAVCNSAVARCIIQGIDEREPVTGRPNRDWLEDALTDVVANISLVRSRMRLSLRRIEERSARKAAHLRQWHGMLAEGQA